MFTDLSDFSRSYNAIIYMFYTCVSFNLRKNLVITIFDRFIFYFNLFLYNMYLIHAGISTDFDTSNCEKWYISF